MTRACIVLFGVLVSFASALAQPRSLDAGASTVDWSVVASEGVKLTITRDADARRTPREPGDRTGGGGGEGGASANAAGPMRMDFDFKRGSGYAVARLKVSLPFGENFRYAFDIRATGADRQGAAPRNTLEFKLIDASGDNVWWVNRPGFDFTTDWKRVAFKRRHFSFAWGPNGGQPLKEVAYLEIAVTAGAGGKGTVWIDGLRFEELPPDRPYDATPRVTVSSHVRGAKGNINGDTTDMPADGRVDWQASHKDLAPTLFIDFGRPREFGGVVIDWPAARTPKQYVVQTSHNGESWSTLREVDDPSHGSNVLQTPETECRYVRIACVPRRENTPKASTLPIAIDRVRFLPLSFGDNPNEPWKLAAQESPRGHYPLYFLGQASYWTITGVDAGNSGGSSREALISEHGAVEIDKRSLSLEPFLWRDSGLITWADAEASGEGGVTRSLLDGYLPIPNVTWNLQGLALDTTLFAFGPANHSTIGVRYTLRNTGDSEQSGRFYVAARPFQVNPIYQFLNTEGGCAPTRAIEIENTKLRADGHVVIAHTPADGVGATSLIRGDISDWLARGELPPESIIDDPAGQASGAFAYEYHLAPGESREYFFTSPTIVPGSVPPPAAGAEALREALAGVADEWRARLNLAEMTPPRGAEHLWDVVRSQLAYILINRDGAAIQPGSRSYERTWIRDGSLTCNALLDFGHQQEVRAFLDWFAPYQFDNGKVPCCADWRGPDPVPEHDSHGQFIYAMAQYALQTGDLSLLEKHYDRIVNAAAYIQVLRAQRLTPEYAQAPEGSLARAKSGVLPESISHEGYSAKPMHSFWDSLFALRGLKDAAIIARLLGKTQDAERFEQEAAEMREAIGTAYRRTMKLHNIDYLAGCVELGDFDATSTTIALFPVNEFGAQADANGKGIPQDALARTFERYWTFFKDRRDGTLDKPWDAYTPYEVRTIGAFVRLGWRERAHELIGYFVGDQMPREWNAFAEVVWRDRRKPGFIGDIPHTWCGSDFVNSFRSLFVYERESDQSLVLLHGVTRDWLRGGPGAERSAGFSLRNWSTMNGTLSLSAFEVARNEVRVEIKSGTGQKLVAPPGGLLIYPPEAGKIASVRVNGQGSEVRADGAIRVDRLNDSGATVEWTYRE